jgi:hypothetical protein
VLHQPLSVQRILAVDGISEKKLFIYIFATISVAERKQPTMNKTERDKQNKVHTRKKEVYVDHLGSDTGWTCREIPTFQRNICLLSPFSALNFSSSSEL